MAFYVATGRLGSGKSLWALGKCEDAIRRGRPIATNLDLFVEHLPRSKAPIYRLPDVPSAADFLALGASTESRDERDWGWIVLDEGGVWLNSRTWSGGERSALIDWFLHSRKWHWNVVLLSQGLKLLDAQIRENVVEYHVVCRRTDRLTLPFVSSMVETFTFGMFKGRPPKMHMAQVRYGLGPSAMGAGVEWFRSTHLYKAYDTDQKIRSDYEHGLYCYLPRLDAREAAQIKRRAARKPKGGAVRVLGECVQRGTLSIEQATRMARHLALKGDRAAA
ncbi:zonular occludens toxin domain-containing protein [Hydrogenophaga electricum]|uniref:Zona occludens toxin N-terminal domain-containing protein n=1 Tax=Hydrogenophaga electricum TaxID=1230953 RepID=A0ABQ6C9D3_9BURK|nr:zonular occludens toxin domain-containing protein [Hydrogenophaga electricum]GLS16575.1 hypothetical protein GCM10007935_40170 [Hydrogenophaga electricum]